MPVGRKILIIGLSGSGKTTLAKELVTRLNAVHFNSDEVRENINRDLSFSVPDRVEQARRMGWLCDLVVKTGAIAIADFICPTEECRNAFNRSGEAFIVWLDRTDQCQCEDTNQLFSPPDSFDVRVTAEGSPQSWADFIAGKISP